VLQTTGKRRGGAGVVLWQLPEICNLDFGSDQCDLHLINLRPREPRAMPQSLENSRGVGINLIVSQARCATFTQRAHGAEAAALRQDADQQAEMVRYAACQKRGSMQASRPGATAVTSTLMASSLGRVGAEGQRQSLRLPLLRQMP